MTSGPLSSHGPLIGYCGQGILLDPGSQDSGKIGSESAASITFFIRLRTKRPLLSRACAYLLLFWENIYWGRVEESTSLSDVHLWLGHFQFLQYFQMTEVQVEEFKRDHGSVYKNFRLARLCRSRAWWRCSSPSCLGGSMDAWAYELKWHTKIQAHGQVFFQPSFTWYFWGGLEMWGHYMRTKSMSMVTWSPLKKWTHVTIRVTHLY